ncbi:MAG: hypothetical protein H6733_06335 [Alphaproteobacteria bacterium]|nr:hypothetical protein [Alphaproteobacteria bacterium]
MNARLALAAAIGLLAAGAFVIWGSPDTGPDPREAAVPVLPPPLPPVATVHEAPQSPGAVGEPADLPERAAWGDGPDGDDADGGASVLIGGEPVGVEDLPVPPELAATYADVRNAFDTHAEALALCDRWSAPDVPRPGSRLDVQVTVRRIHGDNGVVSTVVPMRHADPEGKYGTCVTGVMHGVAFRLPPGQDEATVRYTLNR